MEDIIHLHKKVISIQEKLIQNHKLIEEEYKGRISSLEILMGKQTQLIDLLQEKVEKYQSLISRL